jgi:hypothetical protein
MQVALAAKTIPKTNVDLILPGERIDEILFAATACYH